IGGKPERVYVLYSADDAGLRVRASADGGKTFGKPVTALEGIYGHAVVGSDGRLHVVTLNGGPLGAYGSAQQTVQYAVSADGGATFSKPLVVSGRDEEIPFFFSNPSLAVDTARKWLYFAYARGGHDAKWDIALAATRDGGKTWVRASLGDGCAIHMVPDLAVDPATGTLHVTYYDSQGAPGRYVHATCGAGLVKCTVVGAINSQPFAALSTERHGSKWIGEYEGLVIDDKRRVLHAVWSQPVNEGGKVVSRIFHAAAKLGKR
ncbi:MAG: sialidase family protein, partial [Acidobacteriota bacterium]